MRWHCDLNLSPDMQSSLALWRSLYFFTVMWTRSVLCPFFIYWFEATDVSFSMRLWAGSYLASDLFFIIGSTSAPFSKLNMQVTRMRRHFFTAISPLVYSACCLTTTAAFSFFRLYIW